MKVLITGAQGQVGKELVAITKQRGFDIISASHSDLDITQFKNVRSYVRLYKPNIIINAAAYTAVDRAEEEQDIAYAINRDGASYLAEICKEQNENKAHRTDTR